jgi:hypothetical protein
LGAHTNEGGWNGFGRLAFRLGSFEGERDFPTNYQKVISTNQITRLNDGADFVNRRRAVSSAIDHHPAPSSIPVCPADIRRRHGWSSGLTLLFFLPKRAEDKLLRKPLSNPRNAHAPTRTARPPGRPQTTATRTKVVPKDQKTLIATPDEPRKPIRDKTTPVKSKRSERGNPQPGPLRWNNNSEFRLNYADGLAHAGQKAASGYQRA